MRILMTTDYYDELGGGVEEVVRQLQTGLSHEVRVFTLGNDMDTDDVYRASYLDLTPIARKQARVAPFAARRLGAVVRDWKPDIIHAHNRFFTTSLAASWVARRTKIPLVLTLHLGNMDTEGVAVRIYENTLGRWVLRPATVVTAVSEAAGDEGYALGARHVTVIPNGVDYARFVPAPTPPPLPMTVAFVGRLISNKGPQHVLEAVPNVPDARFLFVGDGPMRQNLERRAVELDVTDRVSFLGLRSDIPEILQTSHVVVRPSSTEGMPLVVLEAMAAGLPVVATPAGGTAEVVRHGQTGFLVTQDAASVAERLRYFTERPHEARRMGMAARDIVEREYSWSTVVHRYEEVFDGIASRTARV